jgi:ribosome biogenesis GTPase A
MAKARRQLREQLRQVDVVLELCDARLPGSSRNPDLAGMCSGKRHALFLNKSDLADARATQAWVGAFTRVGVCASPFDALRGRAQDALNIIEEIVREMVARYASRGVRKTVRALVVGVPNVGKSAFINRLSGRAAAHTSDRPGVTRAPQWVRVTDDLELLDTPGLLWPRIDDPNAARRLAYLGTIRDTILDQETLAESLLEELLIAAPDAARARFKLPDGALAGNELGEESDKASLLDAVCAGRGFRLSGGRMDTTRAAAIVLDEFRAGKLGRITLETPGDAQYDKSTKIGKRAD